MIPFGMSESEWNRFCDSQKCRRGNYCGPITGLCPSCIMERGTDEQKAELKARSKCCSGCGRILGIYGGAYRYNRGDVCNVCLDATSAMITIGGAR